MNTTERFNIAVLSTTISKERLVNELNALVDQYGAVLVKVVPNQDNYDSQKDIIWFGSLQPDGTSPRIRDNRISWLEPSVGGELIHSSDMGVRPLYGSYSMLGSTEFKVALAEWCNKNEMSIDFYKQYPLPAVFLVYFIQHGIGNAVLISFFFLFLTTVIVWFVTHAKARALRLLGGVPLQRIHFEDTLTIISLTSQGFFVGCAAFFIYLGIASGIDQLSIMFMPFIYTAITFITISAVVVLLISLFVQPKAKHLSFRKIPLKQFRLLGRAAPDILHCSCLLMVVPTTITMASAYRALSNDYASWESLKDAVGISYNDVNGLYNDYWMPMVENFFAEMADRDNLFCQWLLTEPLCLIMLKWENTIISLSQTAHGWKPPYSGDNSDKADRLTPIGFDDIHAELKDFLSKQLPIWTNTGEIQPEGMGFCEFNGDSFWFCLQTHRMATAPYKRKNPLIILVEEPVKTLKVSSFLLPMSSSGNIVFKNEAVLWSVLNESPLMEKNILHRFVHRGRTEICAAF